MITIPVTLSNLANKRKLLLIIVVFQGRMQLMVYIISFCDTNDKPCRTCILFVGIRKARVNVLYFFTSELFFIKNYYYF